MTIVTTVSDPHAARPELVFLWGLEIFRAVLAWGQMENQSYACGKNHWTLEPDLPTILNRYWKGWEAHQSGLERFGLVAGGEAYRIADQVDKEARPILVMHDLGGNRIDRVRL